MVPNQKPHNSSEPRLVSVSLKQREFKDIVHIAIDPLSAKRMEVEYNPNFGVKYFDTRFNTYAGKFRPEFNSRDLFESSLARFGVQYEYIGDLIGNPAHNRPPKVPWETAKSVYLAMLEDLPELEKIFEKVLTTARTCNCAFLCYCWQKDMNAGRCHAAWFVQRVLEFRKQRERR